MRCSIGCLFFSFLVLLGGCFSSSANPEPPTCDELGTCCTAVPGVDGYVLTDPAACSPEAIGCDADDYWADMCGCGCGEPPPGPCDAQDAQGQGACRGSAGVAWNGSECVHIWGCECIGADCADTFATVAGCEAAYSACLPDECPDPADPRVTYTSMDPSFCAAATIFCENGEGFNNDCGCGCIDDEDECPDPADPRVNYISQDPLFCAAATFFCESGEAFSNECGCGCIDDGGPMCEAQDIRGEGPCAAFIGVAWNGTECVNIGGCTCAGSDCADLYPDEAACQAAHGSCPGGACTAQDAEGVGLCRLALGVKFDGMECVGIGGCECQGRDCENLYGSHSECEQATRACQSCMDPDDPNVRYVSDSVEECALIRFACGPGEVGFQDACGCGCVTER